MGQLVNGIWQDDDVRPTDQQGAYVRASSVFRHWVTDDGTAGPSGEGGFSASPGRYHLLVAPSCPWAHRAVIFRALKGLESIVSMSSADAPKTTGWSFNHAFDDFSAQDDGVFRLHQVYTAVDPTYTGKITVPTLWDRERKTIVNNESSEIIRMLNAAFQRVGANDDDYYPASHRPAIDEVNDFVYTHINNGVYRAGFAKTQPAYDEAVAQVFIGLDSLEARLGNQRYLAGDRITEADWRAFPTLLRFDLVYFSHFKCNLRRIQDYPNLANYTRELYQWPGIRETCDFDAIKAGYYTPMVQLNPNQIIPAGPDMTWLEHDHHRDAVGH